MSAPHQQIMEYVTAFLTQAGEGEWDLDFTLGAWNSDEHRTAIKAIVEPMKPKKTSDKIKDPNKPKRGKTSYVLFCADERPAAKAALGDDAKPTEVTAELGRRWNALKESSKPTDKRRVKKYTEAALVDKQRYDDEMDSYIRPSTAELEALAAAKPKRGRPSTKKSTDGSKPKKGKSAYIFFCQAQRAAVKAANPDMAAKDVTTELGRLWKELKADDEREDEYERYQKLAAEDKLRYESEMEATEPSMPKVKKARVVEPSDEEEPEQPNKPTRKRNAYHNFCDQELERVTNANPGFSKAQVRRELTAMWKELSADEKEDYKQ